MDHIQASHSARLVRGLAVAMTFVCVVALTALHIQQTAGHIVIFGFNPYAVPSAIGVILNVMALVYLTRTQARTDDRIWLSLYLVGIIIYGLGEALCRLCVFPDGALFWTTLSGLGSTLLTVSLFLFVLAYTNQAGSRQPRTIACLVGLMCLIMFYYTFSSAIWNVNSADLTHYPWGWLNDSGTGLYAIIVWFYSLQVMCIVMLVRFRRRTDNPVLRRQSLFFIPTILGPAAAGLLTDGILPSIGVLSIPTLGVLFTSLTGALLTYAILRDKILTINPALFAESILSIMRESVVVIDAEGKIIYTNPEARRVLNTTGNGFGRGLIYGFLADRSDGHKLAEAIAQTDRETVSIDHIDLINDLKQQTPVRILLSRSKNEVLDAYVLVMSDISAELESKAVIERTVKRRTKQLHEARSYLLSSINSLEQGFMLIDDDGKLASHNGVATDKLSALGADFAAADFAAAVEPIRWNTKLGPAVGQVLAGNGRQQLHAATGDGLFFELYVTPVLAEKTVIGVTVIIEDVTENKILERSRDEFFSIASHELRTPLTAIRGNMSMALDYFPKAMKDAGLKSLVSDTHNASLRLIAIVNDFLDTSRLEQGRMEFKPAPTAAKPLIDGIAKDLGELMKDNHNTFDIHGLTKLPRLYADSARLQQILYNIIGNAVKFTEHGTISIQAQSKGRFAHILVGDTGKGISPENQQILFHKFQQATDSILTRTDTRGTGLGLYISKLMAGHMGGDVTLASSVEGRGSVFLIRLPLATAEQLKGLAVQPTR